MAISSPPAPDTLPGRTGHALRRAGRGLLDALTGPHGVDRWAELVDPRLATDREVATVRRVDVETPDTVTLHLDLPRGWRTGATTPPRAGQAVTLGVEVDGVRHHRSFTVASRGPAGWSVTVRANPNGTVSRHLVQHAAPGLRVDVGTPFGELVLPADDDAVADALDDQLLLVSGGSGITPVMALLRRLVDEGHLAHVGSRGATTPPARPRVALLHYEKSPVDVVFADELARLARGHVDLTIAVVLTRVDLPVQPHGLRGHFTPDHVAALGIDPTTAHVRVCGPVALRDAVQDWLTDPAGPTAGDTDRLRTEVFHPPVPSADPDTDPDAASGTLRLDEADLELTSDGRSILEQAEAAGLAPEHGCRMGICHTCTRHVTAGAVRDLRNGEVTTAHADAPFEAQICVSTPQGDTTVDL